MAKSIRQKVIAVDLELVETTFSNGTGKKTLEGLATSVSVSKCGFPALNRCTVEINNMRQDDIAAITMTHPFDLKLTRNAMTVKAGIAGEGMSVVFKGDIIRAHGVYPSPDLGVYVEALSGAYAALTVAEPHTVKDQVSGKSLIRKFAADIGWTVEDEAGARDMMLTDPVLNGSPFEKIQQLGRHMNIQIIPDDEKIILAPWHAGIGEPVKVSKHNGLVGYPSFSQYGIQFRAKYSPLFRQGGLVEVESIVPGAKGVWKIIKLEHELQAFGAGAAWETSLEGMPVKYGA